MQFIKRFLEVLLSNKEIHTAIRRGDKSYLTFLIKSGFDLNILEYGIPPLRHAFIIDKNKNELAFILLENGANPNTSYYDLLDKQQLALLEGCLKAGNEAQARLLIYYGAAIDNIEQYPELCEAYQLYKTQIKPLNEQATTEAYKDLSTIWMEISERETNKTLKACYRQKADGFYNQYLQFKDKHNNASKNEIPLVQKSNESINLRNRYS